MCRGQALQSCKTPFKLLLKSSQVLLARALFLRNISLIHALELDIRFGVLSFCKASIPRPARNGILELGVISVVLKEKDNAIRLL